MSSLKVAVRVRPFNQREIDMGAKLIVKMDGKKTRLLKLKMTSTQETHDFTFDYSYWSFDSNDNHYTMQDQIYEDLGTDVINCAFQGYNACVFAYGQTGSGKTFTMMGSSSALGLIPRICKSMFSRMKLGKETGTGYKTHVSYLEIYNEKVKDLLGCSNTGHNLKVREHQTFGPYVENLSLHSVSDFLEIENCIQKGNLLRTTASTNMNDTSSRSHAIFTITFVQAGFLDQMPCETVSKIHLVDLAGSERANATGAIGQRLKEGAYINKSLVTLGSVISALAEQTQITFNKKTHYIPYRDSVLTWLLKDSLGGNSKTIMIAAISPADCNYSETISTLRYANRAKNIINKPTINEDPNVKLIRELREEILKLKGLLTADSTLLIPSEKMLEDLLQKEAQEKVLTEEWTEKWREAQSILRKQKALGLRMSGVGVVLDSDAPHLIGIHDDISTGVTLYSLKEGETFIGSNEGDTNHIILSGAGINSEHCIIRLENGNATIFPKANSHCWLNANMIDEPTSICQGDILLLGRTNMFRFNNPAEAAKLRKDGSRSRLDLSRLSFIAASRENLSSSFYCDDDVATNSPQKREGCIGYNTVSHDDVVIQEEHKQILETIERGLHQLSIEREEMNEQYKNQINQLSKELAKLEQSQCDKMIILKLRKQVLLAKKDMLLWEKRNKQSQIDIIVKQISALRRHIQSKKRYFLEYITKELQEHQDCGKIEPHTMIDSMQQDDLYVLLMDISETLDDYIGQFIRDNIKKMRDETKIMDVDLIDKETLLNENSLELVKLEENIINIQLEQNKLLTEDFKSNRDDFETNKSVFVLHRDPLEKHLVCNIANPIDKNLHISQIILNTDVSANFTPGEEINKAIVIDKENILDTSCEQLSGLCSQQICIIHILRQKIAEQKAQIMKYLEMNCDKNILDDCITILQELQKQYFNLEKTLQTSGTDFDQFECCLCENELEIINNDESQHNNIAFSGYCHLNSEYEQHVSRTIQSIDTNNDSGYCINIPNYIIRGAGKQTHYEYEVKIILSNEKWTLLRRYSRFRELYLSMNSCYGIKTASIPFPRRTVFSSNTEAVVQNRRRQLEIYLRRLLVVCSKIPQSPIYEGTNSFGLCKATLFEFSPFFKKGLFENGKHGTG